MFFQSSWAKIFFGKTSDESKNGSLNDEESLESEVDDVSDKVWQTWLHWHCIYVTDWQQIYHNFRGSSIGSLLCSNCQMMIFADGLAMMQFIILVFKSVWSTTLLLFVFFLLLWFCLWTTLAIMVSPSVVSFTKVPWNLSKVAQRFLKCQAWPQLRADWAIQCKSS